MYRAVCRICPQQCARYATSSMPDMPQAVCRICPEQCAGYDSRNGFAVSQAAPIFPVLGCDILIVQNLTFDSNIYSMLINKYIIKI